MVEQCLFHSLAYHNRETVVAVALGEVVEGAQFHSAHAVLHVAKGSEHNHFGERKFISYVLGKLDAVRVGKHHVGEHQRNAFATQNFFTGGHVARLVYLMPF